MRNIWERLLLNLFKKRLQHRCFSVKFVNYSRTPILKSTHERLALKHRCEVFSFIKLDAWWPMAWRAFTVLERDFSTVFFCEFCVIFRKAFSQNRRTPLSNHFSDDFFFLFCRSVRFAAYYRFIWWSIGKLRGGISKPL